MCIYVFEYVCIYPMKNGQVKSLCSLGCHHLVGTSRPAYALFLPAAVGLALARLLSFLSDMARWIFRWTWVVYLWFMFYKPTNYGRYIYIHYGQYSSKLWCITRPFSSCPTAQPTGWVETNRFSFVCYRLENHQPNSKICVLCLFFADCQTLTMYMHVYVINGCKRLVWWLVIIHVVIPLLNPWKLGKFAISLQYTENLCNTLKMHGM